MPKQPFHLAIIVDDLQSARAFYGDLLGCVEGRSTGQWVDFTIYGHQLVCHLSSADSPSQVHITTQMDATGVPVPHFGVVLDWSEWEGLQLRLRSRPDVFLVMPELRFAGLPGEQGTFFICDPAGNALEFKAMRNPASLFTANY